MRQCWPNSQYDPRDAAGIWVSALDGLSEAQVKHGIDTLPKMTAQFAPSPGQFRELCLTYRAPEVPRVTYQRDTSAKALAWRACQVAYAVRVCGQSLVTEAPPTDFDVLGLVDNAAVPAGESLSAHKHAWAALKRDFERAWA